MLEVQKTKSTNDILNLNRRKDDFQETHIFALEHFVNNSLLLVFSSCLSKIFSKNVKHLESHIRI